MRHVFLIAKLVFLSKNAYTWLTFAEDSYIYKQGYDVFRFQSSFLSRAFDLPHHFFSSTPSDYAEADWKCLRPKCMENASVRCPFNSKSLARSILLITPGTQRWMCRFIVRERR